MRSNPASSNLVAMKALDPPAVTKHLQSSISLNRIRLAVVPFSMAFLLWNTGVKIVNARPGSQYLPGKAHQSVPCRVQSSIASLRKAAASGDAPAMYSLGCLYEHGQRVTNSPVQAMAWYRKAARRGSVRAMNRMGTIFNEGLSKDNGEAHYWLRGSKDDNPVQMNSPGTLDFYKEGIPPDYTAAMYWFQKAARRGSSNAMNSLGQMYIEGHGVPRDNKQARQWWVRAAARNNAMAVIHLADLYLGGWGVSKNTERAIGLYERAGTLGNGEAFEKLGLLFLNGRSVQVDLQKAVQNFTKGASLGDTGSMAKLGELYEGDHDAAHQKLRDFSKAKYWYERLASVSETTGSDEWARRWAMARLAESYESGLFTEQNYQTAMQWYRKLAALNEPYGMDQIAHLESQGLGTQKDEAEAQRWTARAATIRPPQKLRIPECTDLNLETKLRVFALPGSQIVALERRNKTAATCSLGDLELRPNEVAHTSRRWRTLSSDGTDASCKMEMSNSSLEGILLVSPTLLPQVCSEVQSSGYASGPFIPDWPSAKSQVPSQVPKLTLSATKPQYMKGEFVPLHVEVTGAGAAMPSSKQGCPVLLRFITDATGFTRIDEMTPVTGKSLTIVKNCTGSEVDSTQTTGFDFEGTEQLDESSSSTAQFFTLAGHSPLGEMLLVGSNSIPLNFADPAELPRTWGPVKEGVHVALTLDKLIYDVGEDIPLHIAAQVVQTENPANEMPDVLLGHFHLTIIGEDGVIAGDDRFDNLLETWLSWGRPVFCPSPLEAGEVYPLERSSRQVGLLPDKPGAYRIIVTWSPYSETDPSCSQSRGVSDRRNIQPLVTVSSEPITIHITGAPVAEAGVPDVPIYTGWKEHFRIVDTPSGQATAVEDLRSHLQWLRLRLTQGQSKGSLEKQMEPGEGLAGWRFATRAEVIAFFANFTGSADGHSTDPGIERALQHLMGGPTETYRNPDTGWSRHATVAALAEVRPARKDETPQNPAGGPPACADCGVGFRITFAYIAEDAVDGHINVTVNPVEEGWNSSDLFLSPSEGGGTLLVRNAQ
jgi:TPR repeat protein